MLVNKLKLYLVGKKTFILLWFSKMLLCLKPTHKALRSYLRLKLITQLRLGLSHLREHKLNHNFQDSINPLCNLGHDIESHDIEYNSFSSPLSLIC